MNKGTTVETQIPESDYLRGYKFGKDEAQAEIAELVDMLENMVFNANLHHNDAVELLHKHKGA